MSEKGSKYDRAIKAGDDEREKRKETLNRVNSETSPRKHWKKKRGGKKAKKRKRKEVKTITRQNRLTLRRACSQQKWSRIVITGGDWWERRTNIRK